MLGPTTRGMKNTWTIKTLLPAVWCASERVHLQVIRRHLTTDPGYLTLVCPRTDLRVYPSIYYYSGPGVPSGPDQRMRGAQSKRLNCLISSGFLVKCSQFPEVDINKH